ncbi:uncharacterized protein LOC109713677 [Ananas comosus]|uniref:Uncharacterized protein LOC109713677 n=1 Tax=Ananas comosus TaxID=4615 RepID=A0A6P5FCV5_ANACO|nr:uncharacterized protein LOC109713677 [Ananas comosus]
MERLISSSSSSSQTRLAKTPLLHRRFAEARTRSTLLRLRRASPSPPGSARFSKQGERPPPIVAASSPPDRHDCAAPSAKKKGDLADSPCAQLSSERDLASLFFRKVTSTAIVGVLMILITLTIQPILAPPAYASFLSATKTGGKLISSELLSSAWTGFFAGCLHTLSGPDHLAALAPLSIGRSRIESAVVGALWGCGHDAGQVLFGLLFLLLKDRLHIEIIRAWGTRVVGLTLLIIGAMGIKEASEVHAPSIALENGGGKKKIGFATFATGIVHGLQPDALMMVLPALALPSRLAGAAFLGMFLVGTVFAMSSFTVFLGSCSQALKEKVPRITEKLTWAASLVAIFMGLAIIVSQFFGFSLY